MADEKSYHMSPEEFRHFGTAVVVFLLGFSQIVSHMRGQWDFSGIHLIHVCGKLLFQLGKTGCQLQQL